MPDVTRAIPKHQANIARPQASQLFQPDPDGKFKPVPFGSSSAPQIASLSLSPIFNPYSTYPCPSSCFQLYVAPGMANPAELVEFLEELKDSIQKQGTLLESFISRLDAARVGPEDGQQFAGASPVGDPSNGTDVLEEHVDAIAENGQQASRTSPDSNAPEKHESTMADKQSLLLNSFRPLLKEWVAFYRTNDFSISNLHYAASLSPSTFGETIKAVAPQPRSGVASKWKYCESH